MTPTPQLSVPRRSPRTRSLVLMLACAVLLMVSTVAVSGAGATLLRLAAVMALLGCFITCAVVAITQHRSLRAIDAAAAQLAEQRRRAHHHQDAER